MKVRFGLLLAGVVAIAGCAGNHARIGGALPPNRSASSSIVPLVLTREALSTLPRVELAKATEAHFTAPSLPPDLSALPMQGRHVQSSAGSSDLEVAGTFVQSTGPYTGISVQNTAYTSSTFPLTRPAGATGPEELLAPLTSPPGGSCLSATTGAINSGSGPQTYFVVFNNCGSAAPNTIGGVVVAQPIDSTFQAKYVATNASNTLPEYGLEIGTPDVHPSASSTWYVLLYNRMTSSWEIVYTQQGLSTTTYGYSVYYTVFQPGQCPAGLPMIASNGIQLYSPSGPAFSAANASGSGSTTLDFTPGYYGNANCFMADSSGAATNTFTMVSPNTDWSVATTALSAASGTITEYAISSANAVPQSIAAGPDGNMWFTEYGGDNKIGKITLAGSFTLYSLPSSYAGPYGIAKGPDGNMWFTQTNFNTPETGKITPTGTATLYTLPPPSTGSAQPAGIAAGADGNMWIAEVGNPNMIAKVTSSGTVTQYPLPTSSGDIANSSGDIALGSDGNIWFTGYFSNKIGKVTPGGTFTAYLIPTSNAIPFAIAPGPDGNLWFTETSGNKIGKITTAGIITEYPIPTANTQPGGIAPGPDGNMWFTEYSANKIAKVSTSGSFTEYTIQTPNNYPTGIAAGPDGNLWFTESQTNKIGRIIP